MKETKDPMLMTRREIISEIEKLWEMALDKYDGTRETQYCVNLMAQVSQLLRNTSYGPHSVGGVVAVPGLRTCVVHASDGVLRGLFHGWEDDSMSRSALVELENGSVVRVSPRRIQFTDSKQYFDQCAWGGIDDGYGQSSADQGD